jgi:hypothetical protein
MISLVGGLLLEGGLYCFELCRPGGYYWGEASIGERASIGGNTVVRLLSARWKAVLSPLLALQGILVGLLHAMKVMHHRYPQDLDQ